MKFPIAHMHTKKTLRIKNVLCFLGDSLRVLIPVCPGPSKTRNTKVSVCTLLMSEAEVQSLATLILCRLYVVIFLLRTHRIPDSVS